MTQPAHQDQLSAYLDGELTDEEVRTLEHALEGDVDLRNQLARLERVQSLLRAHGPTLAPEGFTARIQAAVAEEARPSVPWWRGRSLEGGALLLAAAAALLIAIPTTTTLTNGLSSGSRDAATKESRYEQEPEWDGVAAAPLQEEAPSPGIADRDLDKRADDSQKDLAKAAEGTKKLDNAQAPTGSSPKPSKSLPNKAEMTGSTSPMLDSLNSKGDAAEAEAYETANTGLEPKTLASASLQYRLYVETTEALAALQRLAGQHGTSLQTESGQSIGSGTLTESETSVYVTISADSASAFTNALSTLGKVQYESSTDMIRGPTPRIRIDLVLIGGMGTDSDLAPNAAERAQQHLDVEPNRH